MSSTRVPPTRRSKWPLFVGGFLVLVVALYFVVTSSAFIRGVVVPRAAQALQSDVQVDQIALKPFSQLRLTQVKLTPKGGEQLLAVDEVVLRYRLMAILKGNLVVDELTVDSPKVTLVKDANGRSNLDQLLDGLQPGEPGKPKGPSEPPRVSIRNVAIRKASLSITEPRAAGQLWRAEVSNLDLSVDNLSNGQAGQLDIAAGMLLQDGDVGALRASLGGLIGYEFTDRLEPREAKGSIQLRVDAASGEFEAVNDVAIQLQTDVTSSEIRQLELVVSQGGERLGSAGLQGTYDLEKPEARLEYLIAGIDRRVLSLVGTTLGIQLGDTSLAAAGRIEWIQNGKAISSQGKFSAKELSVDLGQGQGPTPKLDTQLDYRGTWNQQTQSILIERLDVLVQQQNQEILKGALDRAMHLALEGTAPGFRESAYTLDWSNISLDDWRGFLGPDAPSGILAGRLKVGAEKDGRLLRLELNKNLSNLKAALGDDGGPALTNGRLAIQLNGVLNDFKMLNLEKLSLDLREGNTQLALGSGSGDWNLERQTGGVQMSLEGGLAPLLAIVPIPDVTAQAGQLQVNLQATRRTTETVANANVQLADFKGRMGDAVFDRYKVGLQANLNHKDDVVELTRTSISLQNGMEQGGSVEVTARFQLSTQKGTVDIKSLNLTHAGLTPFLNPALAPNRVQSMNIDLSAKGQLDLAAQSTLQGRVAVKNLQILGAEGPLFPTPIGLSLEADLAHRDQKVDVKKLKLAWDKTSRASNELEVSGRLDLGEANRTESTLSVRSPGMDLTPWLALRKPPVADDSRQTQPVPPPASDPAQEPDALDLPFQPLKVDLDIARVYLDEVEVENWKAQVTIRNNEILLDPFALTLNQAPVKARVAANVGVPGYQYHVAFDADQVPLEPLVATFVPEQKGKLGGRARAAMDLRGAGITGAGLQKNLDGTISGGMTNLNMNVNQVQNRFLRPILNIVLGIPDLIRNPQARLANFLDRASGTQDTVPGWYDEVTQSPLDSVVFDAKAGGGMIQLQQARVQSPALLIDASGTVALAEILTNSVLNLPVRIAFRDSLGSKIGLKPTEGERYTPMPDFLAISRTAGNPKFDVNNLVVARIAGQAAAGVVGGSAEALVERAGGALGNVGSAIGGALGGTNAPGTSGDGRNPLGGLLRGVTGQGTNTPATNAPATNAPAESPRNPLDRLPGVLRPRN